MKFIKCVVDVNPFSKKGLKKGKVYRVDNEDQDPDFYYIDGSGWSKFRFKVIEGNEKIIKILYETC